MNASANNAMRPVAAAHLPMSGVPVIALPCPPNASYTPSTYHQPGSRRANACNDEDISHCGSHAPDRNAEASVTVLTMPFIAAVETRHWPMRNPSALTVKENTNVPISENNNGRHPMPARPPWQTAEQAMATPMQHSHTTADAPQQTSNTCAQMAWPGSADTPTLRMVVGLLNAVMMTITMNAMFSMSG